MRLRAGAPSPQPSAPSEGLQASNLSGARRLAPLSIALFCFFQHEELVGHLLTPAAPENQRHTHTHTSLRHEPQATSIEHTAAARTFQVSCTSVFTSSTTSPWISISSVFPLTSEAPHENLLANNLQASLCLISGRGGDRAPKRQSAASNLKPAASQQVQDVLKRARPVTVVTNLRLFRAWQEMTILGFSGGAP